MNLNRTPHAHMFVIAALLTLVAVLVLPRSIRAECQELKIVEYDDRTEVVCIGEPLTEAEKKAFLEEQRRQDQEAARQRNEEQKRQLEKARAEKAQAEAEVAAERKKQQTKPPLKPPATQPSKNPITIGPIKF